MKNRELIFHSLSHAVLVLIYTASVAWIFFNAQRLFGNHSPSFLIPLSMLLLFVLSAAIVGALVLGRPVMLYLNGSKSEALKFFGYTVGWIFISMLIVFSVYIWR